MAIDILFYLYLGVLFLASVIGYIRYNLLDYGSKILLCLVTLAVLCESITAFERFFTYLKAPVYHIYNVIEIILIALYFLYTVRFRNRLLFISLCLLFIGVEIANTVLYQPITRLNTNFITFECLLVIPMSLYSLYKILINDAVDKILNYVHFWFWTCLLVYFSSCFFFWQFIVYFYKHNQLYYTISGNMHIVINLLVYTGILLVFLYYPKMARDES